jgi:hypothetical protein
MEGLLVLQQRMKAGEISLCQPGHLLLLLLPPESVILAG